MVVAMMLPLAGAQARWLGLRTLRRDRHRAIATFAAGYLVVWVALGALALAALAPVAGEPEALAATLAAAAVWHVAPPRRRLLRRCAAGTVPAIRGWRAPVDWLASGVRAGMTCVATCGVLMLPMTVAHHPVLMLGAALVIAAERRSGPNPERRAGRPREALCLAAAAGVTLAAAAAG
jgi:predicted metal-binding membrane protein